MIIVLFGKPGAGKGTQAPLLAKELGVPTLATGDVLRAAKRAGTKLGLEAKGFMDRGELVPDSVILGILGEELSQPQYQGGVILDGAVRTVPQAEGLAKMLASLGRKLAWSSRDRALKSTRAVPAHHPASRARFSGVPTSSAYSANVIP